MCRLSSLSPSSDIILRHVNYLTIKKVALLFTSVAIHITAV